MAADKEEIRTRNDIVEVIGEVVQLQRRGRNYVGLCPFHQEKTPSFNVDPVTQTFKCFGCGVSGDVFSFIERQENMSFIEAVEFLARRVGLEYARSEKRTQTASLRDAIFQANAVAVTYFRACLERAPVARSYLENRMLTAETLAQFQIGFAPDDPDGLTRYLASRKVDLQVALAAGLVRKREGGAITDAFRGRIMFPIHDEQTRVIGFGGRALGDEQPKYLNTGETSVFSKGRVLYALPFARRRIGSEGYSLLMEGYMDVLTAHQAGFSHAVATLGTALTADHARKLARLAPQAVLAYDADAAGIKAALRAAEVLEQEGLLVRIVRLPEGEDPDSLIRSGQAHRLSRAIGDAVSRVAMELDLALETGDTSSDLGRQRLLRRVIEILATVPTRTERDMYIERVWRLHPLASHGLDYAKEQLHRDVEDAARKSSASRKPPYPSQSPAAGRVPGTDGGTPLTRPLAPAPRRAQAAELLIVRALADPEWRYVALRLLRDEDLVEGADRELLRFARQVGVSEALDEAGLVRRIRADMAPELADLIVQRLQESQAALANEPLSEAVLANAVRLVRSRRTLMVESELRALLADRSEWTEEDRRRIDELQKVLRALKSPQS